jgi:hypothetical protein
MAGTGVAVGRSDGRATALAVVLPLKRGGRIWLWLWFGLLRNVWPLRWWAFRNLDGLQFIYAIRWCLLSPFEPRRLFPPRLLRPERRWHLLFESNFDGDWDEYLENFASVFPKGLATMVWVGAGYTGLSSPDLFKRYARLHDNVPEHYVSGYPTLSANDVRQALVARYGRRLVQGFAQQGYGAAEPRWTTFRLPVRRGAEGAVVRAARELDRGVPREGGRVAPEPFRKVGTIHFARVMLEQQQSRAWLLVTLTHDGPADVVLRQLLQADEGDGMVRDRRTEGPVRTLLACVEGLPRRGGKLLDDDEALVAHLLAHVPRSTHQSVWYSGAPGFTADEVRAVAAEPDRHDAYPPELGVSR